MTTIEIKAGVDIMARGDGCCYPLPGTDPLRFCGCTVKSVRPDGMWNYCDAHMALMTNRSHHPASVRSAHRAWREVREGIKL